jgi:ribosomal protein S18 acetylase RimI-like enzyme
MSTIRSLTQPEEFALPGAPDQADALTAMWESGESRPEWCFVLEDGGTVVGRVGFYVSPTCPPEFLGDLPPDELFLFGLWLPWDDDPVGAGLTLIPEALRRVTGDLPDRLQVRTNVEVHDEHAERVALFDALGMELFQEKQGFTWVDDGSPVEVPDRLSFVTVDEAGRDHYRDVLAGVGEATLDRNDFYYRSRMDPLDWGSVYTTFLDESEAPMWLVGRHPGGESIGFVAVSEFDEPDTATIAFVGVLPQHRGNGYIHDLIAAGTAAAQQHGFTSILSDVDTLNAPMWSGRGTMLRFVPGTSGTTWGVWVVLSLPRRRLSHE